MPKQLLKRFMPDPERIARYPALRFIGPRLTDPSLWQLNRHSAAGAVFWGLWCAMLPMPGQMVVAAFVAIVCRVNLPLCLALVWSSNPFTLIPLSWLAYFIGSHLLGVPMPSAAELQQLLSDLIATTPKHASPSVLVHLKPIAVGAVMMGFLFGCAGYVLMRVYWRWHVLRAWKKRRVLRGKIG